MTSDYARALGARLRAIRTQQGLSLHGVEKKSKGRWKAVVVGSYERGDRAVTVQKLAELADFYGVPVERAAARGARGVLGHPGPEDRAQPGAAVPAAPGPGRPARPLRAGDPEPARRLQQQGPLHPRRGPAVAVDHLRPVRGRADRAADRVGRAGAGRAQHRPARSTAAPRTGAPPTAPERTPRPRPADPSGRRPRPSVGGARGAAARALRTRARAAAGAGVAAPAAVRPRAAAPAAPGRARR